MDDSKERSTSRRRIMALLIGSLAAVSLSSGAMSLALFTDTETVDSTFTSGTIDLDAAKVDALVLSVSAMMPGDSITDDVVVENDGTAQLRYAMSTSSTNADSKDLRGVLTLTVRGVDVDGVGCGSFDGTSVVASTVLFDGTTSVGFGSPTSGAQSGDRVLAAGANEVLCFRVALPSSAGNPYQGASTTTTFTFSAEQTANNP